MAFAGTFYVMPHSIRKLKESGYVVRDMYKSDKPMIPANAGIIVLFMSFISIALLPLIVRLLNSVTSLEENVSDLSKSNLAFLLVVSINVMFVVLKLVNRKCVNTYGNIHGILFHDRDLKLAELIQETYLQKFL